MYKNPQNITSTLYRMPNDLPRFPIKRLPSDFPIKDLTPLKHSKYDFDPSESRGSSSYGGPASPTLVDTPLEEFPPPQPGAFLSRPGAPRLLTPAPHAPVPAGPATAENHLLALGQMSPRSVRSAIASHDLPTDTYRSIINGLVITSEARTPRHGQDLAAQEADHKKKLDDREETIEFLEARLVGYIDTFSQPPDGYVENGRLTTFTIPV